MQLRACSIFGTLLLALCVTSPALAKGKKKAADDAAEAAADKADDGADKAEGKKSDHRGAKKDKKKGKKADEEAAEKSDDSKPDKKADKKKKGDEKAEEKEGEKAEGEAAVGSTEGSAEAEMPDPNVWEKPPEEKEKPKPAEVKAPVEAQRGDTRPISAGLALGWGMKTDRRTGGFAADPYGLAAGLRGGYEFDFKLYVGVWGNFYLGSSESGTGQRINLGQKNTTARYIQFGADVGYDWWIASIIIRPSMEVGMALAMTDVTGQWNTIGDFMIGPGLVVLYPWDNMFIGGEMRESIVTGDGVSALLLAAQFGFRFED